MAILYLLHITQGFTNVFGIDITNHIVAISHQKTKMTTHMAIDEARGISLKLNTMWQKAIKCNIGDVQNAYNLSSML